MDTGFSEIEVIADGRASDPPRQTGRRADARLGVVLASCALVISVIALGLSIRNATDDDSAVGVCEAAAAIRSTFRSLPSEGPNASASEEARGELILQDFAALTRAAVASNDPAIEQLAERARRAWQNAAAEARDQDRDYMTPLREIQTGC